MKRVLAFSEKSEIWNSYAGGMIEAHVRDRESNSLCRRHAGKRCFSGSYNNHFPLLSWIKQPKQIINYIDMPWPFFSPSPPPVSDSVEKRSRIAKSFDVSCPPFDHLINYSLREITQSTSTTGFQNKNGVSLEKERERERERERETERQRNRNIVKL